MRLAMWVTHVKKRYPPHIHMTHKPLWREKPTKTCGLYLVVLHCVKESFTLATSATNQPQKALYEP